MTYYYKDLNTRIIDSDLLKNDSIKGSVMNILSTQKGTLVGKPEFGSNVYKYLFEPLNVFTKISLADDIKSALYTNDPRLDKININIQNGADQQGLIVQIEYTTKNDTEPQIVTVHLKG